MRQRVVHVLGSHLVPRVVPDGVLPGEQVGEELGRKAEGAEVSYSRHGDEKCLALITDESETFIRMKCQYATSCLRT